MGTPISVWYKTKFGSQNILATNLQGWGEYYSGTRLAQNDKHEYTKNIVLEYYSSTDFPVLVLVCSVLAPDLWCLLHNICNVFKKYVQCGSNNNVANHCG